MSDNPTIIKAACLNILLILGTILVISGVVVTENLFQVIGGIIIGIAGIVIANHFAIKFLLLNLGRE